MRRILLSLLVALTVLRGLVGDAMAVQMVGKPAAVLDAASTLGHTPAPHTMLASKALHPCHEAITEAPASNEASLGSCMSCQVCHMSALAPAMDLQWTAHSGNTAPASLAIAWHSADALMSAKPPIL
jgi:hypothetical protein